jgi:hypothetical protein
MPLATTQGKEAALKALAKRRAANKDRKRVQNDRLPAGSSMHFDCLGCGEDIEVPESYTSRPKLCSECQALKELGWLE